MNSIETMLKAHQLWLDALTCRVNRYWLFWLEMTEADRQWLLEYQWDEALMDDTARDEYLDDARQRYEDDMATQWSSYYP